MTTARALASSLGVLLAAILGRGVAMQTVLALVGESKPGLVIGAGVLAGSSLGLVVLLWVTRSARSELLATHRPTPSHVALVFVAGAAHIALFDVITWRLGHPLTQPEWTDAVHTAPLALLAIALTVTSVFEELFLRGFVQGALTKTKLAAPGAITLTAVVFAALHFPDDALRFAEVFTGGLVLGLSRHFTRSTLPAIAPHIAGNLKVLVFASL